MYVYIYIYICIKCLGGSANSNAPLSSSVFTPKSNICTSELSIDYLCEMCISHLPQTHYLLLHTYSCQK